MIVSISPRISALPVGALFGEGDVVAGRDESGGDESVERRDGDVVADLESGGHAAHELLAGDR